MDPGLASRRRRLPREYMTGTARTVFGANFAITSFSLDGQATDACQLLSAQEAEAPS